MYKDVINFIADQMNTCLGFGDNYGILDLAQVRQKTEGGTKKVFNVPYSCGDGGADCEKGDKHFVTPDSSKALITYFEAESANFIESRGPMQKWYVNTNMVVWFNKKKLGLDCNEDGEVMNKIISCISKSPQNSAPYTGIVAKYNSVHQRKSFFNKYGYDQWCNQFLNEPYSMMVINMDIMFNIPTTCVTQITLPTGSETEC